LVFGNGGIGVEEARICGLKWSLVYVLGVISVSGTGEVVEYMEVLTDVGCNVDLLDELKCGTEGVMASQVLTASRRVLMWYK